MRLNDGDIVNGCGETVDFVRMANGAGLSESYSCLFSFLFLALLALDSRFFIGDVNILPSVGLGSLLTSPSGKCLERTLMCALTSLSCISNTCNHLPRLVWSLGKQ